MCTAHCINSIEGILDRLHFDTLCFNILRRDFSHGVEMTMMNLCLATQTGSESKLLCAFAMA